MADTIFIQFFGKRYGGNACDYYIYGGFSQTYDLCKRHGDFFWVDQDYQRIIHDQKLLPEDVDNPLPITEGTAYVSVSIQIQVIQAYIWALRYPKVHFIVGGPAWHGTGVCGDLPPNFTIYTKSVEKYFGVPDFSYKWKMKGLPEILKDKYVDYVYTLDNYCDWGKCIFCNYHPFEHRINYWPSFEFIGEVDIAMQKVFFGGPAMKPYQYRYLPSLDWSDHMSYHFFTRATRASIDVLKEILPHIPYPERFAFLVGAEMPLPKYYKYIKKDSSPEEFLEMMALLTKYKVNISSLWINGWPGFSEQDYKDLEELLDKIEWGKHIFMKLNRLHGGYRRDGLDHLSQDRQTFGHMPFWTNNTVILSQRDMDMTLRCEALLKSKVYDPETKRGRWEPPNRVDYTRSLDYDTIHRHGRSDS
jgi:hypothetical protein